MNTAVSRKLNDLSILYCENNAFKLCLRESILIKRDSPKLNRSFYASIIQLITV